MTSFLSGIVHLFGNGWFCEPLSCWFVIIPSGQKEWWYRRRVNCFPLTESASLAGRSAKKTAPIDQSTDMGPFSKHMLNVTVHLMFFKYIEQRNFHTKWLLSFCHDTRAFYSLSTWQQFKHSGFRPQQIQIMQYYKWYWGIYALFYVKMRNLYEKSRNQWAFYNWAMHSVFFNPGVFKLSTNPDFLPVLGFGSAPPKIKEANSLLSSSFFAL